MCACVLVCVFVFVFVCHLVSVAFVSLGAHEGQQTGKSLMMSKASGAPKSKVEKTARRTERVERPVSSGGRFCQ
jgi:hypothetical protein